MYYQRTGFVFEAGFYSVALSDQKIAMKTRLANTDLPTTAPWMHAPHPAEKSLRGMCF